MLPVYNGDDKLKAAIDSILWQSYQDWELIILDDASTDRSLSVMRSVTDDRIRVVAGERNIGLAARLNMAVEMASGKYFARMDHDDISYPQRIQKQVEYMESHPEIDLLASNCAVFNDAHDWLGKLAVRSRHEDICRQPWNGFYMPHPTWLGKTEWFRLNQYRSYADGAEDQDLMLRSFSSSQFSCLDEVLLAYRQNNRLLGKLLRARWLYVKAAWKATDTNFLLASKTVIAQFAKGCGDIVNTQFNSSIMQRTLNPLTEDEKLALKSLFARLSQLQ